MNSELWNTEWRHEEGLTLSGHIRYIVCLAGDRNAFLSAFFLLSYLAFIDSGS